MALELAALKAGVIAADRAARALVREGQDERATVAYATMLQTLSAISTAEADHDHGWRRVAALLTDGGRRLTVDALAGRQLTQMQLRAATLLDLPAITQIESLAEIHAAIAAAIEVGAPRYNAGDIVGCCTIYWATGQTLLAAQIVRGFAGSAKALASLRQVHEAEPPARPLDAAGIDDYAWALRHAFDATLKVQG